MRTIYLFLLIIFLSVCSTTPVQAGLSEFDISDNQVALNDFMSGGPPKDGIPALTNPEFVSADEADFMDRDDMVVGLLIDGQAKAYPIDLLNWHEIVNDEIGQTPVAVTWCPLTKSAVTFDRRVKNDILEFGVSGLLFNNNVVMYDRNHDGLWSQLKSEGLSGKYARERLKTIPTFLTTWVEWSSEHPYTTVLSNKTGHLRDYRRNPYADYHNSERVMFPLDVRDERLPLKSLVIGINVKGTSKAYPLKLVKVLGDPFEDNINGNIVRIHPSLDGTAFITDKSGNVIASVVAYWFAWSSFHKDTLIYQP